MGTQFFHGGTPIRFQAPVPPTFIHVQYFVNPMLHGTSWFQGLSPYSQEWRESWNSPHCTAGAGGTSILTNEKRGPIIHILTILHQCSKSYQAVVKRLFSLLEIKLKSLWRAADFIAWVPIVFSPGLFRNSNTQLTKLASRSSSRQWRLGVPFCAAWHIAQFSP